VNAVEVVRHRLSLAVRVDDHFTGTPWPEPLEVELDSREPAVEAAGGGTRHADGTYRFVGLTPGAKQLTVHAPGATAFTWTAATPVVVPVASAITPLVVELWPAPSAAIAAGTVVIRGRLITAAAGQEVRMEVVGLAPRNRRTRCDGHGEFAFGVVGPMTLDVAYRVELTVTVPGRTVTAIQILDGDTNPTVAGSTFAVPPGRETRALFTLT
jgi:hypothetical protein